MSRFFPRFPLTRAFTTEAPFTSKHIFSFQTIRLGQPTRSRLFQTTPTRFSASQLAPNAVQLGPNASLTERLKQLIKVYGWYALGVNLALSATDFGIAFAGVKFIGAEHIAPYAASIKHFFTTFSFSKPSEPEKDQFDPVLQPGGQEGFYAMLVLAYTIHKTLFFPVRVVLTAAITPKLVHWLGRRGWTGGSGAVSFLREKVWARK